MNAVESPGFSRGRGFKVIRDCPQHTFIILTKNFGRLYEFEFPDNCWVGFSQTHSAEVHMDGIKAKVKFVSFEPLHSGFDYDPNCGMLCNNDKEMNLKTETDRRTATGGLAMHGVDWIITGRETGDREDQFKPHKDWVMTLVKSAQDQGIPVFMKNNLAPELFKKEELIQELPKRGRCPDYGKLMPKTITRTHQPYWNCVEHGSFTEGYFDVKQ